MSFAPVLSTLVDLVLPIACAGCGVGGVATCPTCAGALRGPPFVVGPTPAPPGLPRCAAAVRYGGLPRELVVAYKEHGRRGQALVLGTALATAVLCAVDEGAITGVVAGGGAYAGPDPSWITLVPVPATAAARQARGHDHVQRLARRAAAVLRADGRAARVLPLLRVARAPADQAGLGAAQRAANLAHAFRAHGVGHRHFRGPTVIVDDVLTTGATLAEAARALHAVALAPDAAAVVAAVPLRHDRSCEDASW